MREILKQSSWLFLAQVLTRAIGFFYTLYLAKNLAVEGFGLYSVALSYFSIIGAFSEFGLNKFLIREIALGKQNLSNLVFNVAFLRLLLTFLIITVIGVISFIFDPDSARNVVIVLAMFATIPQALSLTIDSIFVGLQRLAFSSIAIFLMSVATTLSGVFLVEKEAGVIGVTLALILGQIVYLIFLLLILIHKKLLVLGRIETNGLRQAFIGSVPYGVLAVMGLLYFRVDLLILTYMKGNFEAGIYGVAYRFLDVVIFIPSAISAALFPILVKLHSTGQGQIKQIYFKAVTVMGLIGLIICLIYILILPEIFKIFLPNYLLAIEVIKILALSIPLMFIHIPGAQVLLSTDKFLKQVMLLSVVTLSFNIVSNLLFIPQYGVIGASWVTVLSEGLSLVLFYSLLRIKILKS